MEEIFLLFLDNYGSLGTWISILAVGGGLLLAAIKILILFIHKYNSYISCKALQKRDDDEFRSMVNNLASSMEQIQTSIETLNTSNEEHRKSIGQKIDNIITSIAENKEASITGDKNLEERIKTFEDSLQEINQKISVMDGKTNLLISSDKETLKGYITDKYYDCIEKGYIEPYRLSILEPIYAKYLEENGNTFIHGLMDEIRALPRENPNQKTDKK